MCFAWTVSPYLRLNLLSCLVPHALLSCLHPSEPTNVELYVDGVSDICTKGGDINFVFTGFSVNGKVLSRGQPLGPAGVQVSLRNTGTEAKIQSTVTQPGGK